MTLHRTPVSQLVLGFTSLPKGAAARCAAGLLGAAIALPLCAIAQDQGVATSEAAAPAPAPPSQLAPILSESSFIRSPAGNQTAKPGKPGAATKGNTQANFDQFVSGGKPRGTEQLSKPEVPWVLGNEAHPWPLKYFEPVSFTTLVLQVSSSRDARIMLPGVASDEAENARFTSNKFIVDAIGLGAQARGRQLEEINKWIERTKEQLKLIDAEDSWQAYQFSLEAHRYLADFHEKVKSQSEPSIASMADQIRQAIEKVTPTMEVTDSYEIRMAWYNVLVLLKEGFTLYQTQMLGADKQILDQIEAFTKEHPPISRPEGPLPLTPEEAKAKKAAASASLAAMEVPNVKDPRTQAPGPISVSEPESGFVGALIVVLVAIISGGGLFFSLRRRFKHKSTATGNQG